LLYGDVVLDPEAAFMRELGATIRRLRGATPQASIAEAAGISRTSLVSIEQGKQRVHAYLLTRLADALGSPPDDLLPADIRPAVGDIPHVEAPPRVLDWVEHVVARSTPGQARDRAEPT
jgi:transcriptional regulator with XRE-family HTH domain